MDIVISMTTWNRLEYTKLAVEAVLNQSYKDFELVIVDNGSRLETQVYLESIKDPRVEIHLWPENRGLSTATNFAWSGKNPKYLAKVDNDTIVPRHWLKTMIEYHEAYDNFGFIGGMHFDKEHLKDKKPRITEHNGKEIWHKPYIGGCSFVIKKDDYDRFGEIGTGDVKYFAPIMGLTDYQIKFADAGKVNGYPYPFVWVEHMEHPRSPHHIGNERYDAYTFEVHRLDCASYGVEFDRTSQFYLDQNNE